MQPEYIAPISTQVLAATKIRLEDFLPDPPKPQSSPAHGNTGLADVIDGVTAVRLAGNSDARGSLYELLTTRDGVIEPIVHVYQVAAAPESIRAWVYHRHQHDRLAFTMGRFDVVLYDIRPDSRTRNHLNVFVLGLEQPCLLRIPPLVVHGVRNASTEWGFFINMPTKAYDPNFPDKLRLPYDDASIPFRFDAF